MSIFILDNDLRMTTETVSETIQRFRYKLFTVGALGAFMATLDGSILNVALPTIGDAFNASIDLVAWVILAYSLTLVSLLMIFGSWAGRKGYGFAYRFGYTLFMVGSLVCIFSQTIYILIIGRIVQATGGAMFQAIGVAMVTQIFPAKDRGRWIGTMVMMVAGGLMAGPVLGGVLLTYFSWHSIFILNVPVSLFGLWFSLRYFKGLPAENPDKKIKPIGAVLLAAGLLSLMLGMSLLDNYPVSDYHIWGLGLFSVIAFIAFFKFESSPERAMIGLSIFRNRIFSTSIGAMILSFISMAGALILVPFYLEKIKGLEPKDVAGYLVILPILMFICAPLAGWLSDKVGPRLPTISGLLINGVGLYLLSQIEATSPGSYLILCLVFIGFGIGIFNTPNTSALMGSVLPAQRSVASAISSTSRNIGMTVGISFATAIFAFFQSQYADLGDYNTVFVASYQRVAQIAVVIVLAGIPLLILRGKVLPAAKRKAETAE